MSAFSVELLTRDPCPLCRDGERVVERWARRLGVAVVRRDVDEDAELAVDFGLRVPVVRTHWGEVLAEGTIRAWPFVRAMMRARLRRSV